MPTRPANPMLLLALLAVAVLAAADRKPKKSEVAEPVPLQQVSGIYSFLREGELLELNIQEGRIIGDIQRFGSGPSDGGVMLTHFFENAALNHNQLEFTTKTVHGVYYAFTGRIERGEGKTRAQEDYYRITGDLTEYTSDAAKKFSARRREVTFKSSPDEMVGDEAAESK
jgi:hypothetical protein